MSTSVRRSRSRGTAGPAVRPELFAVGVAVAVAVPLSGASLVADPASAITLAMAALYGLVGVLLAIRRPNNPIGWIFLAILLIFASTTAADGLGGTAVRSGAPLPGGLPLLLIWVDTWAYAALFGLYYVLTVVFPSGHLPGGRMRRAIAISFVVPVAAIAAGGFGPHLAGSFSSAYLGRTLVNPVALLPVSDGLDGLLEVATIGLLVAGVASMIVRFRRARGIEREQFKWLVASLAVTGVLMVATVSVVLSVPSVGTGIWIFALLGYATVPPSVAIAVLRYRLYEIDRLVSRTVSWFVISAVLATVFVSVILMTQALLASITESNTFAVAVSTLCVAALFQPLRRRVQARVDRRFNRARYDTELTMAAFANRLRDEVDLGQLQADIRATATRTVQPATASVWLTRR